MLSARPLLSLRALHRATSCCPSSFSFSTQLGMSSSSGSSHDVYDVVVVGAGLMGSSSAYYAATNKTTTPSPRVLLLEQFDLLHAFGSSHGDSRIFRIAYPNATYARMCIDSLRMWQEIEAASGEKLLEMTGELDFADDKAKLQGICRVLADLQQPFEELTGDQVNERFPGFSLPSTAHAVFNPSAAILNPTRAMGALQKLARAHGVQVRDRTRVVSIKQAAQDLVEVELEDGSKVHTQQCIVTAGPWTKKLLSEQSNGVDLAIRPRATFGTFWKATKAELYTPDRFPVFIDYGGSGCYGLALQDAAIGVKVCSHLGPEVDPDSRQQITEPPAADVANMKSFIHDFMPHVDTSAMSKTDLCMYSMTQDENFLLDFVDAQHDGNNPSNSKKVVVGAGFSGHGAKMTPVIGKILSDLAVEGKTAYPIEMFALKRFT